MRSLLLLLAAALSTGCLSSRKLRPVQTYDMQTRFSAAQSPPDGKEVAKVDTVPVVAQLRMLGPSETRMLSRSSAHRLEHDEYHRWVQPPEKCIARELHMALRRRFGGVTGSSKGEAQLYGDILATEATPAGSAHLAMELRLVDGRQGNVLLSKLYERVEAIKTPGPEAFADAMSAALESIIDEALGDVTVALSGY